MHPVTQKELAKGREAALVGPIHTVESEGFVDASCRGNVFKLAQHKALKSVATGDLTFDERVVLHRVERSSHTEIDQNNNDDLISHKVFSRSFCRSQLLHKSVNLSFTITNIKKQSMDLCGN